MTLQRLLSQTRKAIDEYSMIKSGDTIAVGISGGKDSLTLLYALKELSRFYPAQFDVLGISVDLGFENTDFDKIQEYCDMLSVPYHIVHTQIADIVFDKKKEENPCSLCAKLRKGALNQEALKLGANKIAYAHHMDDVVETLMLSLLYEVRMQTFWPVTHLDKTGLTMIRPLLYVKEADVKGFVNKYQLPVAKSPCPVDGHTKRETVKELLRDINRRFPGATGRIFHGIENGALFPEQ